MEPATLAGIREMWLHYQLRKRTQHVLTALAPPRPFDMFTVLRQYSEYTGRTIRLLPYGFKASAPFAVWVRASRSGKDYVFYSAVAEDEHLTTLLAHEFGHMLAGHRSGGHSRHLPTELVRELLPPDSYPDLNLDRWIANSSMYGTEEEREAEYVAERVRQWARIIDHVAVDYSGDPTLDALTDTLADHRGWL